MIEKIKKIVGHNNVKVNYPLKELSTFKIGGIAKAILIPQAFEELFKLVDLLTESRARFKVVGNASNILFGDAFIDSYIILMSGLKGYELISENSLIACAGAGVGELMWFCQRNGLSGLEFTAGIPGTVGGAVKMNAGANGKDFSSVVKSVTFLEDGFIKTKNKQELDFDYRSSYFSSNSSAIILFAELELLTSPKEQIYDTIMYNLEKRRKTQPKEYSAGSVFKKTIIGPAGFIIDNLGLKGKQMGSAQISPIHANFIVNNGSATSKDVENLIEFIKQEVKQKLNIKLELEIEIYK